MVVVFDQVAFIRPVFKGRAGEIGARSPPQIYDHTQHVTLSLMVRSTIIVRASDALPLAASVDDEQVQSTFPWSVVFSHNRTDGASSPGAQAAIKTYFSTYNAQLRTPVLNREWRLYAAVRAFFFLTGHDSFIPVIQPLLQLSHY
jgi:hypothetical protein